MFCLIFVDLNDMPLFPCFLCIPSTKEPVVFLYFLVFMIFDLFLLHNFNSASGRQVLQRSSSIIGLRQLEGGAQSGVLKMGIEGRGSFLCTSKQK